MDGPEQEIDCLEIRAQGINLEYEYINELKNRKIEALKSKLEEYKIEEEQLKNIKQELENEKNVLKQELQLKNEMLEKIEHSRWWKLRNIIRRGK